MACSSCGVQSPGCAQDLIPQQPDAAQRFGFDQEEQDVFAFAAADREHAVGRDGLHRLAIVVVHLELLLLVDRVGHLAADHHAFVEHELPQSLAQVGVLADHFGDDVARAFQRVGHTGNAFFRADERCGKNFQRIGPGLLRPQVKRERLQAFFAGDGRLGAAFGLVGQIKIFEFALVERRLDARFQLAGKFALLGDGGKNRLAARCQVAEVAQLLFDVADLDFVQVAGGLFAVARNEWHGAAFVEQFDHGDQSANGDIEDLRDVDQDFG